ncbi:MAG: GNAT family N-acetyltransferase [Undibacterium sp.]|nr:GNAT family N-acetyltransferase [Undibacterium sp.]
MKILDTERLSLSIISLDDAAFYLELINDPSWIANISDKGIRTLEAARESILSGPVASQHTNGFSLYVVRRQDDNVAMGLCGLIKRDVLKNVDIGYAFLPAYSGQGYALEAAKGVVQYANFAMGLAKLAAITSPSNQRSNHLLQKLGFSLEEVLVLPGEERMTNLYGLTFTPRVI